MQIVLKTEFLGIDKHMGEYARTLEDIEALDTYSKH